MLRFDISEIIDKVRRLCEKNKRLVDSVCISLPLGAAITIKPSFVESDTAKEIVIFLSDRRVLNSNECCESCITGSLKSLKEIREFLVQHQINLKNTSDSLLYLLIEALLSEIRQFQNYCDYHGLSTDSLDSRSIDPRLKEEYFSNLQTLRIGLLALLSQIANIARLKIQSSVFKTQKHVSEDEGGFYVVDWEIAALRSRNTEAKTISNR